MFWYEAFPIFVPCIFKEIKLQNDTETVSTLHMKCPLQFAFNVY